MKISLIASSIRPWLWMEFMDSLLNTSIEYEVIFVGDLTTFQVRPYLAKYPTLKYIHTGNIKPAQCYEIARRNATGELIMWVADDCEFSSGLLDQLYTFWNSLDEWKTLVSVKTNENSSNNDLDHHRFFGFNVNAPLMAPLGIMDRAYLDSLGGFDRRYTAGQYENDVAMRVYADGGNVVKYEDGCVFIEHLKKHGGGTKFWNSYQADRKVLEDTWVRGGFQIAKPKLMVMGRGDTVPYYHFPLENREVLRKPQLPFEPYSDVDILTVSQCPGEWK